MMKNKLFNEPFVSTSAEYQQCCDLIVSEAAQNQNVVSVYLLGGKWCPGISDIDIVVVYKDFKPVITSPWEISNEARKIFTHRYLSFNEQDFAYFYYFYPKIVTSIRLIYGKDICPVDPQTIYPAPDSSLMSAFNLVDVLVNKLLVSGIMTEDTGGIDVRRTIGELYSLNYTISLVREVTGKELDEGFPGAINALRENWFIQNHQKNIEDLKDMIYRGRNVILNAVRETDTFLCEQNVIIDHSLVFKNKRYHITFADNWDEKVFLSSAKNKFVNLRVPIINKAVRNFYLVLPASFSFFFMAYGSGRGNFSEYFRKCFSNFNSSSGLREIKSASIIKRVEIMNIYFNSLVTSAGFYRIPFTYGITIIDHKKPILSKLVCIFVNLVRYFSFKS